VAAPGERRRRLLLASGLSAAVVALAALTFGPPGFAIAFAVGLVATAWYGDDDVGACLPIAILVLLVLVLMVVLIAFMTFVHQR